MADQRVTELVAVAVPAVTDITAVRQSGDNRDKKVTVQQILSLVIPAPEVNDLSAAVVWANIPDANVPVSAVTQHVGSIDHDALLNFLTSEHFTQAAISIPASQISDFDTEVSNNASVAANSAKVSNVTHTDEVTGSGALAAAPAMISNKAVVTAVATDKVLLLDATDGLLKAADAADFLGSAPALPEFLFEAKDFDNPNNADWDVNALAPAVADSNNAALTVRRFDDSVVEGVGGFFRLPAGATNFVLNLAGRAETAPAGTRQVRMSLRVREIPDNAAPSSPPWITANLANMDIPTNEFFQFDSESFTYAFFGFAAGELIQFELVRVNTIVGTDLTGDYDLLRLNVTFT